MRRGLGMAGVLVVLCACAGCGGLDGRTWRVQDHLVTIYTMPRSLRPGPVQVGVRIQNPDYRILSGLTPRFSWHAFPGGPERSVDLRPGLGRDFRARVELPRAGEYDWRLEAVLPQGLTLTVQDRLQVPER